MLSDFFEWQSSSSLNSFSTEQSFRFFYRIFLWVDRGRVHQQFRLCSSFLFNLVWFSCFPCSHDSMSHCMWWHFWKVLVMLFLTHICSVLFVKLKFILADYFECVVLVQSAVLMLQNMHWYNHNRCGFPLLFSFYRRVQWYPRVHRQTWHLKDSIFVTWHIIST